VSKNVGDIEILGKLLFCFFRILEKLAVTILFALKITEFLAATKL
jgi:hypothetical protein